MKIDITEELADIARIEFDSYPDQEAEYRVERAIKLGLEAVRRIAGEMVGTPEEEALVEFWLAEQIIHNANGKLIAEVLRKRLEARHYRAEIEDAAL